MKKIQMFVMAGCPHCANARRIMDELYKENPEYKNLEIEVIDENKDPKIADQYDYYYVPAYYLDGKKFHEGVPNKGMVEKLFKSALEE